MSSQHREKNNERKFNVQTHRETVSDEYWFITSRQSLVGTPERSDKNREPKERMRPDKKSYAKRVIRNCADRQNFVR